MFKEPDSMEEIMSYDAEELIEELEKTIKNHKVYLEDDKRYSAALSIKYIEFLSISIKKRVERLVETIDNYKGIEKEEDL